MEEVVGIRIEKTGETSASPSEMNKPIALASIFHVTCSTKRQLFPNGLKELPQRFLVFKQQF
jgi:hypothetical protein